jgi:glycosyltransferase involved in cell wall biosynthesis
MKKVIIFTNTDWHFYAHLLPIALQAKEAGYNVKILTNISNYKDKIEQHKLEVIDIKINRNTINPFNNLLLLIKLIKLIYKEKPDLLNNFTIKPIIFGSIASLVCQIPQTINVFLGMGLIFMSDNLLIRCIRCIITKTLGIISKFKKLTFVVQNEDDSKLLNNLGIAKKDSIITQCAVGIDTKQFPLLPEPEGKIVFALVARMIVDKGIHEFIEAAKILKQKGLNAEFWLIGEPDKGSKKTIKLSLLQDYHKQGYIKYHGYQKHIEEVWRQAHVAVLPSYSEGLSRSLLEAGIYGRAIITTDAPGGRDLITHNDNGLLVKPCDIFSLANAMETLCKDPGLRKHFAYKIRKHILKKYDAKFIARKIISLYPKHQLNLLSGPRVKDHR